MEFPVIERNRTSLMNSRFSSGNGYPDSKVHGANMGLIWGQQDPGGPHVGPVNFAIRVKFRGAIWRRFRLSHIALPNQNDIV